MKKNIFFNKKRKKFKTLFYYLFPLLLCGCNTIEGVGTDIKHGGQALERAAEESKECCRPCPYCGQYH